MNDLYEAMGTIAAVAHANGDTIDENIRPKDDYNIHHGFDIIHKSNFMRIGKHRDEERFEVTSPYSFLSVLERNYNQEELNARTDRDLESLPPDQRQAAINAVLEGDLRKAEAQYEEFTKGFSDEIAPIDADLIKLTHGEEDLWNGFLVRDYLYPQADSFSISEYRRTVADIRALRLQTTELVLEVVDVLASADSEELTQEPEPPEKSTRHTSSPGFQ